MVNVPSLRPGCLEHPGRLKPADPGILLGGRWKMYFTYYLFVTKALGRAAARQVMQASTFFCSL